MVCVYGMSHVPALLLLDFAGYREKGAFLVFFTVFCGADLHAGAAPGWAALPAQAGGAPR